MPLDLGCRYQKLLRSRMVIPFLQANLLDLSRLELLKKRDGHWRIWEQKELEIRVALDLDRAVMDPVIDPVLRDLKPLGDLGHGEVARDAARMRLTLLDEQAMTEADDLDRADQHDGTFRRAMALPGQVLGDLLVRFSLLG